MSTATQAKDKLTDFRARHPVFDHVIRMVQYYSRVKGNMLAGAVTYFGFLSFFPILALAFFVVGWVAKVYPDATTQLKAAIDAVLPGMVGNRQGQIRLTDIQQAAGAAGIIGLLGVLYSGLGWLSGMREALQAAFDLPQEDQPNFVVGKLRDLLTLALIGVTLIASVAVSGMVTGLSETILGWLGLGSELTWALAILAVVVGLAANAILFFAIFRLLANPSLPARAMWGGALLGAVGFEILKWLSSVLLALTKNQPAFQAFGIALVLVVWINYFSRVVMYAAAWAYTAPEARQTREAEERRQQRQADRERRRLELAAQSARGPAPMAVFAAGGAAGLWMAGRFRRR